MFDGYYLLGIFELLEQEPIDEIYRRPRHLQA